MAGFSWFSISLAAKCRLLFGLAVTAIIVVALTVPLKWMDAQVYAKGTSHVRRMALIASTRSGLPAGDWRVKQEALKKWWPVQAEAEELYGPAPRLIRLSGPNKQQQELARFVARAVKQLREQPNLPGAARWKRDSQGVLRYEYVLPVRSADGNLEGVVHAGMAAPPKALRDLWWNKAAIVAAAVLAGVLAVLVFYLITTKLILSPVTKLKDLARQVTGGDLTARSELKTGDEFEELAGAFNEMLASLNRSQEELRRTNISLDTRLGELAEANVALFEANKLKSEFLANVSHELRTPLTSIIGFAELLRDHPDGQKGRVGRYIENIVGSGRMLLDLINDLLDLAKIEAGKMELRIGPVKLIDICRNLTDFVRPLADKKQLDLVLDLPRQMPLMDSDSGKIQQILYNLLSNAVKFTPARGQVRLAVELTDRQLVKITVSDTGPGIADEQQAGIFEKFRQIDASVTRQHGGTGLGLAISKELTGMLGGSIRVTSKAGHGATFTVDLPLKVPAEAGRPLVRLT